MDIKMKDVRFFVQIKDESIQKTLSVYGGFHRGYKKKRRCFKFYKNSKKNKKRNI